MTDFRMMTSGASSRGAAAGGAACGAAGGADRLTGAGARVETFVDVDFVPLDRGSGVLARRDGADGSAAGRDGVSVRAATAGA
jgi:hypothetical protein